MKYTQWDKNERAVEAKIPLIGELYRDREVEISVFGQLLVKRTVNDILHAHELARQIEEIELSAQDSLSIVKSRCTRIYRSRWAIPIHRMPYPRTL